MQTNTNKLRQWLQDNPAVSLRKLAAKVGCTNSYLCMMAKETNLPWPGREIAIRIAKATNYEVTPNDLAGIPRTRQARSRSLQTAAD